MERDAQLVKGGPIKRVKINRVLLKDNDLITGPRKVLNRKIDKGSPCPNQQSNHL